MIACDNPNCQRAEILSSENLSASKIVQKFPIPSSSTATATSEDTDVTLDEAPVYCLWRGPEEGTMIACIV